MPKRLPLLTRVAVSTAAKLPPASKRLATPGGPCGLIFWCPTAVIFWRQVQPCFGNSPPRSGYMAIRHSFAVTTPSTKIGTAANAITNQITIQFSPSRDALCERVGCEHQILHREHVAQFEQSRVVNDRERSFALAGFDDVEHVARLKGPPRCKPGAMLRRQKRIVHGGLPISCDEEPTPAGAGVGDCVRQLCGQPEQGVCRVVHGDRPRRCRAPWRR